MTALLQTFRDIFQIVVQGSILHVLHDKIERSVLFPKDFIGLHDVLASLHVFAQISNGAKLALLADLVPGSIRFLQFLDSVLKKDINLQ